MKALLGYCAHFASVRLHEVAVWLLDLRGNSPAIFWSHVECIWCNPEQENCQLCDDGWVHYPVTLPDIAPRLAAAIDAVRERWRSFGRESE